MAQDMNQYEAMFLLPAGASAEMENSINLVRGIIERHGGKINVLKKWDERKLAYELAGNKRGLYIIAYFKAPGSTVTGIERDVNLSEDVLRVLITKADHLNEQEMAAVEPQPIQPREERSYDRMGSDDRRDRGDRGDRGERAERGPRRDNPRRDEPAPETAATQD